MIKKIRRRFLFFKAKLQGGMAFSSSIRDYYLKEYNIKIGYGTYGGCFSFKNIPSGTIFGNYCSIGEDVKIFRANHPLSYFTLHPLFYNPVMGYVNDYKLPKDSLIVGHDVWIGSNSMITPSVKEIGNGSVIGAGSIVTKNVPPYAVVAGNPAKIIKMRFPDPIIKELEKSQWWLMDKSQLIQNKEYLENITGETIV